MRQNLDDMTLVSTEAEDCAGVRVEREHLLHHPRQAVDPAAHIGRAAAQVNPVGRHHRDYLVNSARTIRSAVGSTVPSIRNRVPLGKATTILPAGSRQSATGRSTPGRSLTSIRAKVAIARIGIELAAGHLLAPGIEL